MQSIATYTKVKPNLVMPGNRITIRLNNSNAILTACSRRATAFSRKGFLPFGILMAFLFLGGAAIAQCPSSVEGAVLTASTNPVCSGQTSSINISVSPGSGGTYSGSFTNGRTFTGLTPTANTIKPTYTFTNNTTGNITEYFELQTLAFTTSANVTCPATSMTGNTTITIQPVANLNATLNTPPVLCNGGSVSINVSNPNGVGGTYNRSTDYGNAGHTTTSPATGQAYGTFTDILTNSTASPITVVYTFTPVSPGSGCVGTPVNVSVVINPNPTVVCPANKIQSTDNNVCTAVVNGIGPVSFAPATCNGTVPTISYTLSGATNTMSPVAGSASGATFNKGITTVTYTIKDGANNTGTCSFTVTVNDTQGPTFINTLQADINVNSNAGMDAVSGDCGAVVSYAPYTATDNCGGTVTITYSTPSGPITSPAYFPVGTTTVTVTATDNANPANTTTDQFTVTVVDNENPTITCPANITTNNSAAPNDCGAPVSFAASASDNCSAVVTYTIPGMPNPTVITSPYTFPVGTTTVTATATDPAGHTAQCTFNVTVNNITGNIYVNDNSSTGDVYTTGLGSDVSGNGTRCKPYATLAKALSVAVATNTIYVDAGNYPTATSLTLDKGITIRGANFGVAGNSGSRTTESVIDFTTDQGSVNHILVSAPAAVIIDGFRFEDNLLITGAAQDRKMIYLQNSNGHNIGHNVLFRNAGGTGGNQGSSEFYAVFVNFPDAGTTATIDNNYFTGSAAGIFGNQSWRRGIWKQGGTGTTNITNNTFDNVRSHINLEDNVTNTVITGNTFNLPTGISSVNFGGNPLLAGTYVMGANNNFTGAGTYIKISTSAASFVVDATACRQNGNLFSGLSLADEFTLDAYLEHGPGLVRAKAGNVYAIISSPFSAGKGSIQTMINKASVSDVVNVQNGTFNEDININKGVTVRGQSRVAIIRGLYAGNSKSVIVSADNVTVKNVTITRDYGVSFNSNPGNDWASSTKTEGIIAENLNNFTLDSVTVTGNRNGVYIHSVPTFVVKNSIIRDNRTGFQMFGDLSSGQIVNNFVTNNFTHGVLINFDQGPTNAQNLAVNNNNISGNWYSQINFQNNSAQGTNVGSFSGSNFNCNWYGTVNPDYAAVNAGGMSYNTQVPSQFGGTDPGVNADIRGVEAALITYVPYLTNGADNNAPDSLNGFQPVPGSCNGSPIVITSAVPAPQTCGATGSITLTFTGGVPPYNISTTGPVSSSVSTNASPYTISGLTAGTYNITITDANGIFATTAATVTYNPVTNTTTGISYTTIQGAIDAAATTNGHTLQVCAGRYAEEITVSKSLTILGPNASVIPCSGTRVAEAVILPAHSQPFYDGTTEIRMMQITANNVTIKGLTFDGDNAAISGGTASDTADINAADGIDVYEDVQNITVQNNVFKNLNETGVQAFPSGGVTLQNNIISNNQFVNIAGNFSATYPFSGYGIGVLVYNNFYAAVNNNCMTNARIGVQTGNFNLAGNPASISNNQIESRSLGIWYNLHYQSASNWTVSGNNLTTKSGAATNTGIFVSSIQSAVSGTITNNNVTGAKWGIELWNNPTTNPITVSDGTLTNCETGVFANNFDSYGSDGETSSYTVSGINITSNVANNIGIHVKDNSANTNNATTTVQIQSSTLGSTAASSTGLLVTGAGAFASFTGAGTPAAFTGQSKYITLTGNGTDAPAAGITATTVIFDGQTGASASLAQNFAIEDKIDHKIDSAQLGFVLVKASNTFVTPASFIAPGNTAALVQRAADAASAGFTVNVKGGIYNGNISITKNLNFEGAGLSIAGTGVRPATESQLNAPTTGGDQLISLSGIGTTASFNGFNIVGKNLGAVLDGTQNLTIRNTVAELDFSDAANNLYSAGASLTIDRNLFKAINGTNPSGASSHIFSGSNTLTVTNNKFTSADAIDDLNVNGTTSRPVWLNITTGTQHAQVMNNEFNQIDIGVLIAGNASDVSVTNNDFIEAKRLTTGNGFGAGIALFGNLTPSSPIAITNNNFLNSETGVRTSTGDASNVLPATNLLGVHNNSFVNMSEKAIRITSGYTGTLDATCNWYGSSDLAIVAPQIQGPVTFIPYLNDGTDTQPATRGFQPAPGTCVSPTKLYVNDGSSAGGDYTTNPGNDATGNGSTTAPYATINKAISVAKSADTIFVDAGSYYEDVIVNKEVTIKGLDSAKTIVYPATSNPVGSGGTLGGNTIFLVQANNVTIRDLTANGNNPNIGGNIDARNGIVTDFNSGDYTNLVVHHTTVKNIYYRGIYSTYGSTPGNTFNFHHNTVMNVQGDAGSIAIFNFGNSGIIDSNKVTNANDGIVANQSTGTIFSNNITSGIGIHTDNNGGSGGTADTLKNNTVSNVGSGGYGILVFLPSRNVIVQENTITGSYIAIGNVGQGASGITPIFRRNTIDGQGTANSTGVFQTTSIPGFSPSNVSGTYLNNFIKNNQQGFYLKQEAGRTSTIEAHENSITGNPTSVAIAVGPDGAGTLTNNFSCNWYGGSAPVVTGGSLNYQPTLITGTDNEPSTPGFQPVPGSCSNCATPDVVKPTITLKSNPTVFLSANNTYTVQLSDVLQSVSDNCDPNPSATINTLNVNCSNLGTGGNATPHQPFVANSSTGNQNFQGELGMDFRVNAASGIIITQLGAFDHQANGLAGSQPDGNGNFGIRVAIFNKATQAIVPGLNTVITGNGDASANNYRYKNIAAVTLPQGDYLVIAKGYNANELLGNSYVGGGPYPQGDNAGGAISYLNDAFYGDDNPAGFTYPVNSFNTGTSSVFKGGTFTYALSQGNTVTVTATDVSGNQSQASTSVTVVDTFYTLTTKDITVNLNSNGQATIQPSDVLQSFKNNCGVDANSTFQVSPSNFNCSSTSGSTLSTPHQPFVANSSTGNQNFQGELGMDFRVNAASGIIITQLGAFDHQANGLAGSQPDGNGNFGIRVAIFNKATQAIVPGLNTVITGNGDASANNYRYKNIAAVTLPQGDYLVIAKGYNANELLGNSYVGGGPYPQGDNAGGAISYLNDAFYGDDNPAGFTYPVNSFNTGTSSVFKGGTFTYQTQIATSNVVTLTATDAYGNQKQATANVTVADNTGPVITTKNITLALDNTGNASLQPNDVLQSPVTDNCSVNNASITVSPNSFTCADYSAGGNPTPHQPFVANSPDGNQNFTEELGMDFRVNAASGIIISQLGAFDHQGDGILGSGIRVAIFDKATKAIVAGLDATITGNADANTGNYRYKNITPVTLPPGNYVVLSKGYVANDLLGNSFVSGGPYPQGDNAGGAISFPNTAFYDAAGAPGFTYPNDSLNNGTNIFKAGTFTYTLNVSNNKIVTVSATDTKGNVSTATATVTLTNPSGSCTAQPVMAYAAKSVQTNVPVVVDNATMSIKVYPNPSGGQFTVQLYNLKAPKVALQIMDANGQVVVQQEATLSSKTPSLSIPVDISKHASGIYLIKVISADGIQTAKVVVSH